MPVRLAKELDLLDDRAQAIQRAPGDRIQRRAATRTFGAEKAAIRPDNLENQQTRYAVYLSRKHDPFWLTPIDSGRQNKRLCLDLIVGYLAVKASCHLPLAMGVGRFKKQATASNNHLITGSELLLRAIYNFSLALLDDKVLAYNGSKPGKMAFFHFLAILAPGHFWTKVWVIEVIQVLTPRFRKGVVLIERPGNIVCDVPLHCMGIVDGDRNNDDYLRFQPAGNESIKRHHKLCHPYILTSFSYLAQGRRLHAIWLYPDIKTRR